ncbi:MAG: hypothetical protein Q8W47_01400 [Candidatus Palauibacterales bacterium]|nr:hypothetical protein [Candidatus Palauibacterales bacterium]
MLRRGVVLVAFGIAVGGLLAAVAACLAPAGSAVRLDPARVLRAD